MTCVYSAEPYTLLAQINEPMNCDVLVALQMSYDPSASAAPHLGLGKPWSQIVILILAAEFLH